MLLHPTYFPNIATVVSVIASKHLTFEVHDHYQKQTYRNRCEIYGANGKLALSVPVTYTQKQRQYYKDVQIATDQNWQIQHLKSLDSAYRMSPFYEFYIDELMPVFKTNFKFLIDLNLKCFELVIQALELEKASSHEFTKITKQTFEIMTNPNCETQRNYKFSHVIETVDPEMEATPKSPLNQKSCS